MHWKMTAVFWQGLKVNNKELFLDISILSKGHKCNGAASARFLLLFSLPLVHFDTQENILISKYEIILVKIDPHRLPKQKDSLGMFYLVTEQQISSTWLLGGGKKTQMSNLN